MKAGCAPEHDCLECAPLGASLGLGSSRSDSRPLGCAQGGDWFEHILLDYDVASNWGNWVSAAGLTGGRINHFNITKQSKVRGLLMAASGAAGSACVGVCTQQHRIAYAAQSQAGHLRHCMS